MDEELSQGTCGRSGRKPLARAFYVGCITAELRCCSHVVPMLFHRSSIRTPYVLHTYSIQVPYNCICFGLLPCPALVRHPCAFFDARRQSPCSAARWAGLHWD